MTQERLLAHFRATLTARYEVEGELGAAYQAATAAHAVYQGALATTPRVYRRSRPSRQNTGPHTKSMRATPPPAPAHCRATRDLRPPAAAAMGEFEAIGPEATRAKVNVVVGPVNAALDEEQADCDKVDPGDAVNGVVERIEGVRAARARLTGQNQEISCRLGNRGETLRCSWAVDLDGTEVE